MNMDSMNILFGVIGAACGVYCLYAFYMLKFKGEINQSVLLPKDVDVKKCKDKEAYMKAVSLPLLVFAIVAMAYGLAELYNALVQPVGTVILIFTISFFVVLIWFGVYTAKLRKKYF